ncbi:MAG: C10 family peptidase [Muribaculaceae bacterium]|nr:C10 family peptidase [Muribaculaceae bacterium]
MKKLFLFTALVMAVLTAVASPVDLAKAEATAQRFMHSRDAKSFNATPVGSLKLLHAEVSSEKVSQPVYYVFNADNAFVIVAGDDRAQEILAYGDKPLSMSNLPQNMKFWLDYYRKQIEFLQAHPGLKVDKPSLGLNRSESVEPLIEALWDQGYPYYSQCPMDGDRRGLTGCATTSLAQIFYMWKYPTSPTPVIPGYTTRTRNFILDPLPSIRFDWENMLPEYRVGYYTDANKEAVAQLMRYIGQAEEMDYTNEGSEAFEDDILRACNMFGYVGATVTYKSVVDFDNVTETTLISDEDWSTLMQSELLAGRPMVFCAYDYSSVYNMYYGHAFDVDGYDATNGTFHINWGWSGTGNGYFAMNAFSYQGTNYHIGQLVVMGIEPPAPIEAYDPVMQPADTAYITLTSFRADWTDQTPAENVTSYTLEVNAGAASEPGVYEKVFTESFPYATENGTRPLSKIDNCCTNKGWTGSNVYESRGGLRLGGNGSVGTLTTPAVDMTQSGGKMTVVATMKPYSSDTDVPVNISCGNSVTSVTVSAEGVQTVVLECEANDQQTVTIATSNSSKRVIITQLDIYSATPDAAKMVFSLPVETGDSISRVISDITDKFYTVRNLTEGGTYSYRVKAFYVNGTQSAWSNIQEVTLFDNGSAPHEFTLGDVNHDGGVTIKDVTDLIDYLLGSDNGICTDCADLNGDQGVTIADVTALIDMLLGSN